MKRWSEAGEYRGAASAKESCSRRENRIFILAVIRSLHQKEGNGVAFASIADELANDSIITAKLWRQVPLSGSTGNEDSGEGKKRMEKERDLVQTPFSDGSSAYFPNANARNNPYFTSR